MENHDTVFLEQIRMPWRTFRHLQQGVEQNHGLIRRRNTSMSMKEMLIIFLWKVDDNRSNRDAQTRIHDSAWTISITFKRVLHALLPLYDDFVKPPRDEIPFLLTRTEQDWTKLSEFHDIRGDIDATQVSAFLPPPEKAPYQNWKGLIRQNILDGCTLDLPFFYVLLG